MSLRAIVHLMLHVAVPGLVAWPWFRDPARPRAFGRAWLLLLLGSTSITCSGRIFAPGRCSIGFHPLHTMPAIAV